jgi:hypothetical protein
MKQSGKELERQKKDLAYQRILNEFMWGGVRYRSTLQRVIRMYPNSFSPAA